MPQSFYRVHRTFGADLTLSGTTVYDWPFEYKQYNRLKLNTNDYEAGQRLDEPSLLATRSERVGFGVSAGL